MRLIDIIGICVCVIVLINLFIFLFLRKIIMLADIPINYRMHELNSFFFLVLLTSFVLILLLVFSGKFLKFTITIYVLLTAVRAFFYYIDNKNINNNMVNVLNENLIWMFLFPLIIGLVLYTNKKTA